VTPCRDCVHHSFNDSVDLPVLDVDGIVVADADVMIVD
jgi:hypothetical protein